MLHGSSQRRFTIKLQPYRIKAEELALPRKGINIDEDGHAINPANTGRSQS
jgi:hypothetical protein